MMSPVATVYISEKLKAVPSKLDATGAWTKGTMVPSATVAALRASINTPPYWVLPEWETTIQFNPPPSTAGKLCELTVDIASCLFDSFVPVAGQEGIDAIVTYAIQLGLPQPYGYSSINTTNTDWYGKTVVQPNQPGSNLNTTISLVTNLGSTRAQTGPPILVRIPQGPQPLRLSLIQHNLDFVETLANNLYSFSSLSYPPTNSPTLSLMITLEPVE